MGKIRFILLLVCTIVTLVPATIVAAETNVNIMVNPAGNTLTDTEIRGSSNWNKGVVQAIGTGVPSALANSQAQANAMARRAAVVDAYRNLLEAVGEVRVEASTTVKNFELESDVVNTRIAGLIQGAHVVNEQQMPDGSYQVTMEINLFGVNSIAAAIADKIRPSEILPELMPSPDYNLPAQNMQVYTGVVVDARGLGLERVMSPRIYDETGRIIYGNMYIDPEMVVHSGMVDYTGSSEMINTVKIGRSRAGTNPIIVKALELKDFNANVVISKADADMILATNTQSNFLAHTSVVFEQ